MREPGVEPGAEPWKGPMLPLHHSRLLQAICLCVNIQLNIVYHNSKIIDIVI